MSLNLTEDKKIAIELSDGSLRRYQSGITCYEIAKEISSTLAKKSIACSVNGNLTDLSTKLNDVIYATADPADIPSEESRNNT